MDLVTVDYLYFTYFKFYNNPMSLVLLCLSYRCKKMRLELLSLLTSLAQLVTGCQGFCLSLLPSTALTLN